METIRYENNGWIIEMDRPYEYSTNLYKSNVNIDPFGYYRCNNLFNKYFNHHDFNIILKNNDDINRLIAINRILKNKKN